MQDEDFSLWIEASGPLGTGKSTLINAIAKFAEANGVNLRLYATEHCFSMTPSAALVLAGKLMEAIDNETR